MKKIIVSFFFIVVSANVVGNTLEKQNQWLSTAFSAGYVFKNDCKFKEVYGHGIVNIITADGCYYPWDHWGLGAKLSYWRAKGKTTFLKQHSLLQEVPVTLYLRGIKNFDCGVQLQGSLGGGVLWMKEKSYLANTRFYKGIAEVEVGLNYTLWRGIDIVSALRYLFPPQRIVAGDKVVVGGIDLRAGIGFSF